jgi:CBS domain-containing protein
VTPPTRERRIDGVITDRDIALKVVAVGLDPSVTTVDDVVGIISQADVAMSLPTGMTGGLVEAISDASPRE